MTEVNQIYKCGDCGDMFEVIREGTAKLQCCGKELEPLQEKTTDEGNEKHVPVIEKTDTGVKVKVGSVPHPMEEKHYIEWIEIMADNRVYRKFLKPGESPEAEFDIKAKNIRAREHCNVHDLWKS